MREMAINEAKWVISHFNGDTEEADRLQAIIDSSNDYFYGSHKPLNYSANNPNSHINQIDLAFERLCVSMEDAGVINPKKLTVYEFNIRRQYFQEKFEKLKNS